MNSNNNSDDYFEDLSIIDEEKPKNVKPYVRKRNRKDVLRIISRKIIPNRQLLEQCRKTSITTTPNEDENKNIELDKDPNKEVKLIPQNQLKYLNENGTMIPSQKINIKNIIKNIHNANVNKKSTSYIYDHKDYPARRIKQNTFLFHRVGSGVSDEKAQLSLQTHKRKMEGVQNAIIKKIKNSNN